jgi:hypothetical protein
MGSKIAELLKWKKPLVLTKPDGTEFTTVYLRILGDYDLQEAYKYARVASTEARKEMKDETSARFIDEISAIDETTRDQLEEVILAAKSTEISSEAIVNVVRPELPDLDEVSVDPDAATLEEQEKLQSLVSATNDGYNMAIEQYIQVRTDALKAEIAAKNDEEVKADAKVALININALKTFLEELSNQKIFRAVYTDKSYTTRLYSNVEEWKNEYKFIKDQISEAFSQLERNPEDLKN